MNPELQTLKEQARKVVQEERQIAATDAAQWWDALLAFAQRELAPVWQYVGKVRPSHFTAKTMEQALEIRIPGHRPIFAFFHGRDSNGPCWWRAQWGGSTFREGELPWWMVTYPTERNRYMTYHHTLGAAMLAAEEAQAVSEARR